MSSSETQEFIMEQKEVPNTKSARRRSCVNKGPCDSEALVEEPKYDPGAVFEWIKLTEGKVKLKGKGDVALRVKKHLLSIGWDLHYIHKSPNKKELRYRPPPPFHSRAHISLINACYFLLNSIHQLNEDESLQPSPSRLKRSVGDAKIGANGFGIGTHSTLVCDEDVFLSESKKRKVQDAVATTGHDGDVCLVCHHGNGLILCGQCTSPFHSGCIGLEENPKGVDWSCPSCCCAICTLSCGSHSSILTCAQCYRKHHDWCFSEEANSSGEKWFCGKECGMINSSLCELIGKPVDLGVNSQTWTLHKFTKSSLGDDRVLEKFNGVFRVIDECFDPIEDPDTGRNIIEDLICSREQEDPNYDPKYQGFYTVGLETNGVMVSVACVRIYQKVAEMALAGTGYEHRRLGMCRILMDELQKQLGKMGVERLVVPAVLESIETWTGSLGFSKMTFSEIAQLVHHNLLRFRGTIMCQKLLMMTGISLQC